ncbi:MAG: PAS domain S-box protein [Bacteroidota bacterium]
MSVMKNNGIRHDRLIAELKSISETVSDLELFLNAEENGIAKEPHPSMSDLRASELRYRRLFESAQDGILLLDAETGVITDANPFMMKMLGYDLDELIGKRLWEIGAFHDAAASKAGFKELQQEEYIRYDDLPLQTKDGQSRQVEFVSNVYLVKGKKVIQCNIRDITDRKHAEGAFLESEERYRRLFETAQDGILLLNAETGAITDANPYILKMLGYQADEMLGKKLWEIGAFHDAAANKAGFKELQQKEYIRYEDLPLQTKDGRSRQVEFVSNVYLVKKKKVIQCNIRDITARIQAEAALIKSERQYRQIVETAQEGVWVLDKENRTTFVNKHLAGMLGYTVEEITGRFIYEFMDEEGKAIAAKSLENRQKGINEQIDFKYIRKDGTALWALIKVSSMYDENQAYSGALAMVTDITERRKLEVHLRESEERYHLLFENSIDAILLTSPDGSVVAANRSACQLFGGTEEEIKRAGRSGLLDSSDPRTAVALEERDRTGKYAGELGFLRLDGTPIQGDISTAQYNDKEGNVRSSMIIRDITERMRSEKALRESDEKFHQLADNITDAFWIRSPDMNKVHYISPAFERIWGRSVESLYANPEKWPEFIHPEDHERVTNAFDRLTETNSSLDMEYRILRPGGEIRWVHVRGFQVRDGSERLIRHIGIVSDITQRKQAEKRIVLLAHTLESIAECVSVTDLNDIVLFVNGAFQKTYGYTEQEIVGQNISMVRSTDAPPPDARDIFESSLKGGWSGELINRAKDGRDFPVSLRTSAIHDENGEVVALVGVATDITDQKMLQSQLLQSQWAESIGTLAGGIAHDFNNILGIILGYTFLIEKHKSDAQHVTESLAAVNQAVQRGASLVSQILTFARKAEVSFEPVSLADLAQELVSMLQQTLPKTILFKTVIPKDIPFLLADRAQMHQVLLNLCLNARDAMPNGGSITITLEKQPGDQVKQQFPSADQESYVCMSVADSGEGMNESTRKRIFDPFFTTKPKGKGTGLGLSVVFGVVQSHQGFINVESSVGHGATFRLYFPLPNVNVTGVDTRSSSLFETGGNETILLVEDEAFLLETMLYVLESKGYQVLAAHDGAEGVETYKKESHRINLVFTDMGLPAMTGLEVFKRLKEINPHVKVIFASGFFDPDAKSQLLEGGAKNFLQKPFSGDQVLRMVRKALDENKGDSLQGSPA